MNKKALLNAGVAVGLFASLLASPSHADEVGEDVLEALEQVEVSTLGEGVHPLESNLENSEELAQGTAYVADSTEIVIPDSLNGDVTLSSEGGPSISVSLPNAGSGISSTELENGMTSFDNEDGSSTVPVAKEDGSVQVTTVISSSNAPNEYIYQFNLPEGISISPHDGGANFVNAAEEVVGGIAPAWAVDAEGAQVPTRFKIEGETVTQIVDHEGFEYPVVADPMWGTDLIKSASWINRSGTVSLSIVPTGWNRFNLGFQPAISAGWKEALAKTPRTYVNKKWYSRSSADTTPMYWQYRCHQVAAFAKGSWNLEPSKIRSTYFQYVQNLCN